MSIYEKDGGLGAYYPRKFLSETASGAFSGTLH